jgi:hypothetical protein
LILIYHFTATHLVESIRREGVTLGLAPCFWNGRLHFLQCIWLTTNPSFTDQGWDTQGLIDYSRTDARFTIDIPECESGKLIHWKELYVKHRKLPPPGFADIGRTETWRVFEGIIKQEWIVDVQFRKRNRQRRRRK